LFVTLGTIRPYRFDAMIDAVLKTGLATHETNWQLGCTHRDDLPGNVAESVSDGEFEAMIRESDVVITHSGVGTILRILELGKSPIVIPRRRSRGEHVDDHQAQISELVSREGLATAVEAPALTAEDIYNATEFRILQQE
jgi:UDP-N-acetylglucosamine transferase subunit ALG13